MLNELTKTYMRNYGMSFSAAEELAKKELLETDIIVAACKKAKENIVNYLR